MLKELKRITAEIYKAKYSSAKAIFLAGSVVRGEGTSTSDLDLVVVFDHLPCAYRDSYFCEKWPIEAFVHDPQTLEYFFREFDRPTGIPSLASMVAEGIELPAANDFTASLKQLARTVLDEGPPQWTSEEVNRSRYSITDLVNDLRDPRSKQEMVAISTSLYPALANHYLRSRHLWSAQGKAIPRRLHAVDASFAKRFLDSFDEIFLKNCPDKVVNIAAEVLEADGGFLFEGHKLDAPPSWRIE
jgi:hypothetical protein